MATKKSKSAPAAAPDPNAWTRWVALSTAILAVSAAIASLKSGGYGGRIQILATQENDRWGQFQSKSVKESLRQSELDSLELAALAPNGAKARKLIADKTAFCKAEIERYEGEKKQIQAEAQEIQAKQADLKKHSGLLGQAVMLLQIAITLSSIAALLRNKGLWYGGLAVGGAGLLYAVVGLLI